MKKEKIIIFDFDGVIVDSFNVALEIHQLSKPTLTRERYADLFNGNITDAVHVDEVVREIDFDKEYAKKFESMALSENIKTNIQNLSGEFKLFIVSSTVTKTIEDYLRRHGVLENFVEIMGSDIEASKVKKFRMIFEKYSINPSDAIFISDTSGDIKEAKEARIGHIIAILGGYQNRESLEKAKPGMIVENLDDFVRVVKDLTKIK